MAERINHFPQAEPEAPAPVAAPGLEFDKYRITPGLLEKLGDLVTVEPRPVMKASLDDLIAAHTQRTFADGQRDIIRMMERLMATQENQG